MTSAHRRRSRFIHPFFLFFVTWRYTWVSTMSLIFLLSTRAAVWAVRFYILYNEFLSLRIFNFCHFNILRFLIISSFIFILDFVIFHWGAHFGLDNISGATYLDKRTLDRLTSYLSLNQCDINTMGWESDHELEYRDWTRWLNTIIQILILLFIKAWHCDYINVESDAENEDVTQLAPR